MRSAEPQRLLDVLADWPHLDDTDRAELEAERIITERIADIYPTHTDRTDTHDHRIQD